MTHQLTILFRRAPWDPSLRISPRAALITTIAVITIANVPGALHAQATWQSNGSGVIYAPAGVNVGIGTASPLGNADFRDASGRPLMVANFGEAYSFFNAPMNAHLSGNAYFVDNAWNRFHASAGAAVVDAVGSEGAILFGTAPPGSNPLNWTWQMKITNGGNVGIGTTNPAHRLAVNGTIGAKEVIVTNTGWADYVFQPGYRLQGLGEIERYIQKNRHLPGIPTEKTVREQGVSIGEMQAKLLAKMEEMTLHMIELDKQNKALKAKVARLESSARGRH